MRFDTISNIFAAAAVLGAIAIAPQQALSSDDTSTDSEAAPATDGALTDPNTAPLVSFDCVAEENGRFATIAKQEGQQAPLIVWTAESTAYFGDEYSPKNRCDEVTERFNAAVDRNQGEFRTLLLTNGVMNGETVICALGTQDTECSSSNLLFTLKPENAERSGEILSQLMAFGLHGSEAGYITETQGQVYVNLGVWQRRAFGNPAGSSQ